MRIDDRAHVDEAREDFRFRRRLGQAWDSAGNKVGNAVLFGIIGMASSIIGPGFWA